MPGDAGPRFYASGTAANRFATLREYGLDVRVLDGELSAASALKMSYAGITKGTQAVGAAMLLAATRAGSADALFAELNESQAAMLAFLKRSLSRMPPKAYRWVAEMQEIADFVGDDPAARALYSGAAQFYQQIAQDLPVILLIFHHKNALAHDDLNCCATFVGTVNENVEPLPGVDSTQMRPPCISIIRFDMARPSPVPPFFLVTELSAC